jgi:benzoate/toluate 1,2-dioxygenase beta subunit
MSALHRSAVEAFLYAEARALDDQDWDTWLTFYAPDASFWMPAWDDNNSLVEDPQTEISLIYYARRDGLEDRVFRIMTERSSASTPPPRTSHNISNVEILSHNRSRVELRFNWLTLSYRYKVLDTYFGTSFYTLDVAAERPLIKAKKVILKNYYMIDIYHI